jgi:uncharacterized protein (TIGR02444 family)
MNNEFWTFSLATYAADGVAEAALAVQDEFDIDVNVLLYVSWMASRNHKMTHTHLAELEICIQQWRQRVVIPLRSLRRQLKDYPDAATVREGIKALELQSERQQQDMMWKFSNAAESLPALNCPLAHNLGLLVDSDQDDGGCWKTLLDCLATVVGN